MIRVKICGITREKDALLAAELGAHAIGFIFYPGSPRYLSPEKARKISASLPPFVQRVGVFVNEDPSRIKRIRDLVGLDVVQLHGEESPDVCALFYPRVVKALRIKDEKDLAALSSYRGRVGGILLDTFVRGVFGGTGKTFNWSLAQKAKRSGLPLILAGGLNPQNVEEAIKKVRPSGLDISSGVEITPGVKHPALLKALFERLRPYLVKSF